MLRDDDGPQYAARPNSNFDKKNSNLLPKQESEFKISQDYYFAAPTPRLPSARFEFREESFRLFFSLGTLSRPPRLSYFVPWYLGLEITDSVQTAGQIREKSREILRTTAAHKHVAWSNNAKTLVPY